MLQLLKSNPTASLGLALIYIGITIASGYGQTAPIAHLPLGAVLNDVISLPLLAAAAVGLSVVTIAWSARAIAKGYQLASGNGWFPFMICGLCSIVFVPVQDVSVMVAVALAALALVQVLQLEFGSTFMASFNAGFLISSSTLFFQPMVVLLLLPFVAYILLQLRGFRPLLTLVVGAVLPYLLCLAAWFVFSNPAAFTEGQFMLPEFRFLEPEGLAWAPIAVIGLIMLVSLGVLSAWKHYSIQHRKHWSLVFWVLLVSVLVVPIDGRAYPMVLMLPLMPLSIFAGEVLYRGAGKVSVELIHLFIVAAVALVFLQTEFSLLAMP